MNISHWREKLTGMLSLQLPPSPPDPNPWSAPLVQGFSVAILLLGHPRHTRLNPVTRCPTHRPAPSRNQAPLNSQSPVLNGPLAHAGLDCPPLAAPTSGFERLPTSNHRALDGFELPIALKTPKRQFKTVNRTSASRTKIGFERSATIAATKNRSKPKSTSLDHSPSAPRASYASRVPICRHNAQTQIQNPHAQTRLLRLLLASLFHIYAVHGPNKRN